MLLLVWANSAYLTRAHYSQDYSPDKGALRGSSARCVSAPPSPGNVFFLASLMQELTQQNNKEEHSLNAPL